MTSPAICGSDLFISERAASEAGLTASSHASYQHQQHAEMNINDMTSS